MLKNYILISLRTLSKEKYYTVLNLVGLIFGLTAFLILISYVIHEMNYDRYHTYSNRTYRIETYGDFYLRDNDEKTVGTSAELAKVLQNEYPEVERVTRFCNLGGTMITPFVGKGIHDWSVMLSDTCIFDVFDFTFTAGDTISPLQKSHTAVISKELSAKLFGDESPIGKQIRINSYPEAVTITAEIATPPTNSHVRPSMIISLASYPKYYSLKWDNPIFYTYAVLIEGADIGCFTNHLQDIIPKYVAPHFKELTGSSYDSLFTKGRYVRYSTIPLTDIRLHSNTPMEVAGKSGNGVVVSIFAFSAFAILLLACINYINLTTSRTITRVKEISIRKSLGAERHHLILQFLTESIVLVMVAVACATALTHFFLPEFCTMSGLEIEVPFLQIPWVVPCLLGFGIVLGSITGIYPAIVISQFSVRDGLYGISDRSYRGAGLRKVLVVIQFAISYIIIMGAVVTNQQFDYIMHKDWGYDRNNLVIVHETVDIFSQRDTFKDILKQHPFIEHVGFCTAPPNQFRARTALINCDDSLQEHYGLHATGIDSEYLTTIGAELIAGRMFDETNLNDTLNVIMNEAAMKMFGFSDINNRCLTFPGDSAYDSRVIGVVKDYHFLPLQFPIEPMIFFLGKQRFLQYAIVRSTGTREETVNALTEAWHNVSPQRDIHYEFFGDALNWHYRHEISSKQTFFIFSIVTLIIACLGLIGLISYATVKRRKEIGIRKVNGASIAQIMIMLSKDTLLYLGIGILIGAGISYYFIGMWLSVFAYHIALSPYHFVFAATLLAGIALVTENIVSFIAARQNPSDAIRDE